MIELFSRIPDGIKLQKDNQFTPIHISDDISSLSAILLDDEYYNFLRSGRDVVDGLSVLTGAYLVPFKMKAWLDLTDRKTRGQSIDPKDIKKNTEMTYSDLSHLSVSTKG